MFTIMKRVFTAPLIKSDIGWLTSRYILLVYLITQCGISVVKAQAGFRFGYNGMAFVILSEDDKTVALTNSYTEYGSQYEKTYILAYKESLVIPSTVTYDNKTYTVVEIGEDAFAKSSTTDVTIPATVNLISQGAFYDVQSYPQIIILEDGSTTLEINSGSYFGHACEWYIGRNMVWQGKSLDDRNDFRDIFHSANKIVVSDAVTKLHEYQFADNQQNLKTLILGNGIKEIPAYLCSGDFNLEDVTIPNSVEVIGNGAFSGCFSIINITIPANVKSMYATAYYRDEGNYENITIEDSDTPLILEDSWGSDLFNSTKSLYLGRNITRTYDNPNSHYFFTTNAIIGDKVTEINNRMFGRVENIKLGSSVKKIGSYAFNDCKLESIDIPSSTEEIGAKAFYSCKNLKTVILHEGLQTIGDDAFTYSGLTELTIPASVISIGEYFMYYSDMTSLTFKDSDVPLKVSMYQTKIENLYIGRNIDGAFTKAVHVTMGEKVTSIPEKMFQVGNIETISIGSNVARIGTRAFSQSKLTNVEIPSSVKEIDSDAFSWCSQLTSLTLNEGLERIGAGAFYNNALTEVSLPASLEKIEDEAFIGNPLKTLSIADSAEPLYVEYKSAGYQTLPATVEQLYLGRDIKNYGLNSNETRFSNVIDVEFGENVTTLKGLPNGSGLFANNQTIKSVKAPWKTPIAIDEKSFTNTVYNNASLIIPQYSSTSYSNSTGWKEFKNVVEVDEAGEPTIIESVHHYGLFDKESDVIIYDLQGNNNNKLLKGLNIVRMSDGTTRKVVMK